MASIIQFPPERAPRTPQVFSSPGEDVALGFLRVARRDMPAQRQAPTWIAEIVELEDRRNARKTRRPDHPLLAS